MFYKATVQAVLLYGSETWSLLPSSLKGLEGFHIQAAWQMSGLRPEKKPNGSWTYPCTKEVLKAAGLETISHYMDVRRQTVANFIVNQPIFELCAGAVRKRGLPVRPFWWDQPMDLDLARRGAFGPSCQRLRSLQWGLERTAEPKLIELIYGNGGGEACKGLP